MSATEIDAVAKPQALEARIHFALDGGDGQAQRDLALELLKGFNGYGHACS